VIKPIASAPLRRIRIYQRTIVQTDSPRDNPEQPSRNQTGLLSVFFVSFASSR